VTQPIMYQNNSIPTLADVARKADVSTATVSRCLNSPNQLSQTTRIKVMSAVAELGYAPNFNAQSLAARRTNTVGAIIPTMDNAIFARGLQAFQEELGNLGKTLIVASSSYRPDLELEHIRTLTARGADGLLLIGYDRNPEIYNFLKQRDVPSLVAWAYQTDTDQTSIGFNNEKAIRPLIEEVIALGHKNIAFISAPKQDNDRARDRVNSVRMAMESAGLNPRNLKLIETPYSIENGQAAFQKLMALDCPPTVAMCGNDVLAAGALKQAKEMELSVPNYISITGFDDIELASLAEPQLTTVHVPHKAMGKIAAQMLGKMIDQQMVESQELSTELRLRGTLASPRA
jgi:LacI family transcriptional regulator